MNSTKLELKKNEKVFSVIENILNCSFVEFNYFAERSKEKYCH